MFNVTSLPAAVAHGRPRRSAVRAPMKVEGEGRLRGPAFDRSVGPAAKTDQFRLEKMSIDIIPIIRPAGRQWRSRRIIGRDPCRRTSRQRTTSFYTELSANLCEQVFLFAQFSFETCDGDLHRREFGDAGG